MRHFFGGFGRAAVEPGDGGIEQCADVGIYRITLYRARRHVAGYRHVENVQLFQKHGRIVAPVHAERVHVVFLKEPKASYYMLVAPMVHFLGQASVEKPLQYVVDMHEQDVLFGRVVSVKRRARNARLAYYLGNADVGYILVAHQLEHRVGYLLFDCEVGSRPLVHLKHIL